MKLHYTRLYQTSPCAMASWLLCGTSWIGRTWTGFYDLREVILFWHYDRATWNSLDSFWLRKDNRHNAITPARIAVWQVIWVPWLASWPMNTDAHFGREDEYFVSDKPNREHGFSLRGLRKYVRGRRALIRQTIRQDHRDVTIISLLTLSSRLRMHLFSLSWPNMPFFYMVRRLMLVWDPEITGFGI
jgi:hypothetical protein